MNVLRLGLHPRGLAPRILNLPQWRTHLLTRLAREAHLTADPGLAALHRELVALPAGATRLRPDGIAVPLRLRHDDGPLTFLSTVTTFGTAVDLTACGAEHRGLPARRRAHGCGAPAAVRRGAQRRSSDGSPRSSEFRSKLPTKPSHPRTSSSGAGVVMTRSFTSPALVIR